MIHMYRAVWTVVTLLALGTQPATARGASYTVNSCAEAVRELMPATDWSREPGSGSQSFAISTDCREGAVAFRPSASTPNGGGSGVRFTAPAPLSLVDMEYRQVVVTSQSVDPTRPWRWDYTAGYTDTNGVSHQNRNCITPCSYYIFHQNENFEGPRRSVWWYLTCAYETNTFCGGGAEVRIFDAKFEIDDPSPPRLLGQPTGAMLSGGADLAGHQTTGFDVSDLGSGVYKADIEVDGTILGSVSFSSAENPHCVRPFRVVRPCPADVSNGITIDTTQLADGAHTATLRVYDATERNVASYGPIKFTTANKRLGNYCGAGTLDLASTHLPRKPLAFGKSWIYKARINGVPGFDVVLLEGRNRVTVAGSSRVADDGRVAFRLPAGTNRTLRLAARAPGSTASYLCSKPSQLRVKSRLHLAATPRKLSNGRAVTLRGRLFGRANARRPIVIQARATGSRRWATVRVVRTRRDGRFVMRYRFVSTFSTVTYVFRAQARSANGYPYATGTSRPRRVVVIGARS